MMQKKVNFIKHQMIKNVETHGVNADQLKSH